MIKYFLHKSFLVSLMLSISWLSPAQDFQKIRINPDQAYGGNFSDYLYDIEYIPLETTKESLFGQVSELIITESSYIILDKDTKSVLFFSWTGKLLKRIYKEGNLSANVVLFNKSNNLIAIVFQNSNSDKYAIHSYSLSGDYIKKIETADLNSDLIYNSIVIDEKNYWLRHNFSTADTIPSSYFSKYNNNVKVSSAVPLDSAIRYSIYRLKSELGYETVPYIYNNFFYFSTPFEHKLYKINATTGQSSPIFQIVFPSKFGIDNSLLTVIDNKKMDSIVNKIWFTDISILSIENIEYSTNKIIFKAKRGVSGSYGSDGKLINRNFLYRFKDGFLASFERISPDISTYFLPFYNTHTIAFKGFYRQNEYLYTFLSSLELFAAHQANKNKKTNYPPILQEYFKTQNRKSNPVIVRMKLKD